MTLRDRRILADLVEYRYLTTTQVARLHFSSIKVAQRRLRALLASGLVVRAPFHGGARAGFHEWAYAASPRAAGRRSGRSVPSEPLPLKDPTRGFRIRYAEHHRALTDARIWLREAEARSVLGVRCRFVPGYAQMGRDGNRRRFASIDLGNPHGLLVPDGVFELSAGPAVAALLFLEVDRGTEPLRGNHPSSVLRKLEMYGRAYDGGLYAPFSEFFGRSFSGFRVAFVAPDETRVQRILEVAEVSGLAPLVWATVVATVRQPGDFSAAVWRDAPGGPLRSLLE